ncbi:MAG: ATP-binding protein, partial [Muribaculaceae bacterium]|nr:ATP-binding protein [Muribaculaceae bacterium]
MEFYRTILNDLERWKNSPNRKPLLIRGARQIGKTWALKRFGETCFENSVYVNFEEAIEIRAEFEKTKAPSRIIPILRTYLGQRIDAGRTLIIFDEIQECNSALNSLKYFCEEAPEYHIIAAGSLLGVMLSKGDSFPVGKVDILDMYPLTFREFLWTAEKRLLDYIDSLDAICPLPQFVFNSLEELFRRYMISGGMPEAALAMLEGREMSVIDKTLENILASYAWDFAKHSQPNDTQRIAAIWQSLPSQLSKENRKFVYGVVKTGARAREYESALLWLEHAGLIIRSFCLSKPLLPLTAYDDLSAFKVYAGDVGLLRALAKLPNDAIFGESNAFVEFKGALMENYILQSLMCQFSPLPRYWMST